MIRYIKRESFAGKVVDQHMETRCLTEVCPRCKGVKVRLEWETFESAAYRRPQIGVHFKCRDCNYASEQVTASLLETKDADRASIVSCIDEAIAEWDQCGQAKRKATDMASAVAEVAGERPHEKNFMPKWATDMLATNDSCISLIEAISEAKGDTRCPKPISKS